MRHEQILTILYDMALVIGSQDRVEPLVQNTLRRLIYHSGYPVGLFMLGETENLTGREKTLSLRLGGSMGDHRLQSRVGDLIQVPTALFAGASLQFQPDPNDLASLPLRQGHYRCALRLHIPGEGAILLLSPEPVTLNSQLPHIFQPIMANLAKALKLCRHHEAYTQELIHSRDAARADNLRFRTALDGSNDCIFLIDPEQMRFVDFNRTAEVVLDYAREELLRMGPHDITPEYDREQLQDYFRHLNLSAEDNHGELFIDHITRSGRRFPVEIRLTMLQQTARGPMLIAVARDITERKQAEERLFKAKERAQVTLHSIGDGVITTDPQGYVDYLNPVAEKLTGWTTLEAKGKPLSKIFHVIDEHTKKSTINPVARCLSENCITGINSHTVLVNRYGEEIAIEDSAAPIRDRSGQIIGVVLVFHDVSKARALAQELTWQASHDALTGLINRHEFERRLEAAFQNTRDEGTIHTLFYLDLDQFKIVNDTCGHIAGDELLRQLTSHLQQRVRDNDTLARLGGDEFGVLLLNCPRHQAERIAESLRESIKEFTFVWDEKSFKVGSSIGIVEITSDLHSTSQIMSQADVACYVAKERGGNQSHLFQPDDLEMAQRQGEMRWVTRINDALERNRLLLYAQPIHALGEDGVEVSHYELLIRMLDDDGGLIEPGSFLPAAERYKLMYAIDRWVISKALHTFTTEGIERDDMLFTINLSGLSLTQTGLLEYIKEQFASSGASPHNFCFEVTETAAISNLCRAHDLILELKSMGCTFALDDFGTGLSSFTYLKSLPVDYLKIDGSFIRDILDDPVDDSMVSAINKIGHDMGLKTIAEYVESEAILERLQQIGIDYVQGYLFGHPIALEDLYDAKSPKSRAMITASSLPLSPG